MRKETEEERKEGDQMFYTVPSWEKPQGWQKDGGRTEREERVH